MTRDSTAPPSAETPLEPGTAAVEADPSLTAQLEADSDRAPLPEEQEIDPRKLDPDAIKVVNRLLHFGHEAYLVGGCVRDLLVGMRPKDFDIATSAHPGEVRSIFRNCRLIGRRFRLAHIYFKGGKIMEVSTFRANPTEVEEAEAALAAQPPESPEELKSLETELEALDGDDDEEDGDEESEAGAAPVDAAPGVASAASSPAGATMAAPVEPPAAPTPPEEEEADDLLISDDNVFGTAEQDARRRDFTINGLFYDVEHGRVIDFVRGRRDLDMKLVRTIGDPEVRMREDPVRILRAVRFACKLGFDIESRTYAAMEGAVEDLPRCAPPRLLEETFKLLRGAAATPALKLLDALDALKILLQPVGEFVRSKGREGAETAFFAYTRALDKKLSRGKPLEDAVLLAALLYPLAREAPPQEGADPQRPSTPVDELLQQFVRTARLPRRIAERCRMLLLAQKTLTGQRRRRGGLASFRAHPIFNEALDLFEIIVEGSGEHRDALEAWKSGGAPQISSGAEGPAPRRKRRRRRGGRGRGPAGEGGGDAGPANGDGSGGGHGNGGGAPPPPAS